jgi:hypothetical protein
MPGVESGAHHLSFFGTSSRGKSIVLCLQPLKKFPCNDSVKVKGGFVGFFYLELSFNSALSAAPRRMLGLNPGLFPRLHWQGDNPTTLLDFTQQMATWQAIVFLPKVIKSFIR